MVQHQAVRTLAVEIAMLGAQGINPMKKYTLKSIPNRSEMYGEEVLQRRAEIRVGLSRGMTVKLSKMKSRAVKARRRERYGAFGLASFCD